MLLFSALLSAARARPLVKTGDLDVIRLYVAAGQRLLNDKASGEITVQCLEGCISFTAQGKTQELTAGQFLYLVPREPHTIRGIENSSLLVTILRPRE